MINPIAIPKNPRALDPNYLAWVRKQLCVVTARPAECAHHLIGYGFGGMATKCDDYLVIPLTNEEHAKLHNDPKKWEQNNHSQIAYVLHVLDNAIQAKVISIENYEKYRQMMFDTWDRTYDYESK